MFGRSGIIAACVLGTEALIIPPGTSKGFSGSGLQPLIDPKGQRIRLPCPSCSSALKSVSFDDVEESDDLYWIQSETNTYDVVLDFQISADDERLELNGEPIYPPHFHRDAYLRQGRSIYVDQVPANTSNFRLTSGEARRTPLEITASGLKIEPEHAISEHCDAVIPLKFLIMGLERETTDFQIAIDLLMTGGGELLLLRVDNLTYSGPLSLPPRPEPSPELSESKKCSILPPQMCKLRNMINAKLSLTEPDHSKPCSDRHRRPSWLSDHQRPRFHSSRPHNSPDEHYGRPHHMRPYSGQREHHKIRFLRAFARGVMAVLIPVMAGITVGLSVSFLGLVVGRLIGYLWIKFGRGGRRGEGSIALEEDEDCESKASVDQLPAYHDDEPTYVATGEEKRSCTSAGSN